MLYVLAAVFYLLGALTLWGIVRGAELVRRQRRVTPHIR